MISVWLKPAYSSQVSLSTAFDMSWGERLRMDVDTREEFGLTMNHHRRFKLFDGCTEPSKKGEDATVRCQPCTGACKHCKYAQEHPFQFSCPRHGLWPCGHDYVDACRCFVRSPSTDAVCTADGYEPPQRRPKKLPKVILPIFRS